MYETDWRGSCECGFYDPEFDPHVHGQAHRFYRMGYYLNQAARDAFEQCLSGAQNAPEGSARDKALQACQDAANPAGVRVAVIGYSKGTISTRVYLRSRQVDLGPDFPGEVTLDPPGPSPTPVPEPSTLILATLGGACLLASRGVQRRLRWEEAA